METSSCSQCLSIVGGSLKAFLICIRPRLAATRCWHVLVVELGRNSPMKLFLQCKQLRIQLACTRQPAGRHFDVSD